MPLPRRRRRRWTDIFARCREPHRATRENGPRRAAGARGAIALRERPATRERRGLLRTLALPPYTSTRRTRSPCAYTLRPAGRNARRWNARSALLEIDPAVTSDVENQRD